MARAVELHDVRVLASPLNEELWTDEAAYGWAQAGEAAREHEVQALLERLLARRRLSATLAGNVHSRSSACTSYEEDERRRAVRSGCLGTHVKSVDAGPRALRRARARPRLLLSLYL